MSDECSFCMTPVLLTTLEAANREIAKLRRLNRELTDQSSKHAERRYEVEAQLAELLNYRKDAQ